MNALEQLKTTIAAEAGKLFCEGHPHVCALRDTNPQQLEKLVLQTLEKNEVPISVETALAQVESALSETES